jgi:hypothetical protein
MAEAENVDNIMEKGEVGRMGEVAHNLAAGLQELHHLDTSCGDKNITLKFSPEEESGNKIRSMPHVLSVNA